MAQKHAEMKRLHDAGAKIQVRYTPTSEWSYDSNPHWDIVGAEFRVLPGSKPKDIKAFLAITIDDRQPRTAFVSSKESAHLAVSIDPLSHAIKAVEIL